MRGTTTMSATSAPVGRSYASGTYPVALLGDTIGDNFGRTASRFGDREALVDVAAGRRWTYTELAAELRRVDTDPVRHGQDRRDPGQHQPRLRRPRAGVRAAPGRGAAADRGPGPPLVRLRGDDRRGSPGLPGPGRSHPARQRRVG